MRTSALARLVMMALIMFALLVPLTMEWAIVSERAGRRDSAAREISGMWGQSQTLAGPVLTVPYRYSTTNNAGKPQTAIGRAHFLPETLQVDGRLDPEIRWRGLFPVVVYKAHLALAGRFAAPDLSVIAPSAVQIQWNEAILSFGVSDPRGLSRRAVMTLDGQAQPFGAGIADVGLFSAGIQTPVRTLAEAAARGFAFRFEIDVNGTREIRFLPSAGETTVQLTSAWPHPGFVGGPAPDPHQISASGFSATWHAPDFGRGYPQRWTTAAMNREELRAQADASAFGVVLMQPVDIYQQAERAVKYAALFIVLTFVIFFLWEIFHAGVLHPVQYLFVGFALCVFYLLLLSLSEHLHFDAAYVMAAGATVALIAGYSSRVLRGVRRGAQMGLALTMLYGFLYLLLRLEDYALLAGSVGLFLMLAVVMYATRRVDWYELRLGASAEP